MNENTNHKDLFTRLSDPFHPNDIEWRAGATNADKTKALALAYITSRAVMDRLDEVVGPQNWRDEYAPGPDGGVICGLSLRIDDEWITKWDGAENTDFEAIKGGLSDAFKRAGYKWGIGRYLYKLDSAWVACEAHGKNIVLKSTPALPAWALPKTSKPNENKPAVSHIPSEREQQILAELGFVEKPASPTTPAPTPAQVSDVGNSPGSAPSAIPNSNGSNGKKPVSWSSEVVKAVLTTKLAPTPAAAVQLLNSSGLDPHITPELAIAALQAHVNA